MEKIKVVILAAGIGKRMKSTDPKAIAQVGGVPMVARLVESIKSTGIQKPIVVIGHGAESVRDVLGESCDYAMQERQLGTAHALLAAKDVCGDAERILVLYGDHPFVSKETIKNLSEKSLATGAEIVLATTDIPNFENEYKVFANFARIIREGGKIVAIREYKDATDEERKIREVNPGYYVFRSDWLWANIEKVKNKNAQGEYYLTDLLSIAKEEGARIEDIQIPPREAMGANSRDELEILKSLA